MSGAKDRLLGDAREGLSRKLAEVAGRGDLDERFAVWLLGPDGGLSAASPDLAAASTMKNYRGVAALGFAAASQGIDFPHQEALRKGLLWLSGRPDCVAGSPAGFTTDPVALLGIALGTRHVGDAAVAKGVADWFAQFVASSCTLPSVQEWERCLFLAAARLVDCSASLALSDAGAVADVRVALRSHNLLPPVHRAYEEADEESALSLMLEPAALLSYAQAALRAAAFDSILRSAQAAGRSHRFLLPAHAGPTETREVTMNDRPRTKVFHQYTWDSDAHQQRVVSLANSLRNPYGFEATMDVFVPGMPPEGLPHWMLNQIESADFVLVVCTENNKRRWEGQEPRGQGKGAKWEGGLITRILYLAELQNRKFIPVAFQRIDLDFIPTVLSGAVYYDLSKPESFEGLIRHLSGQPAYVPAPLGTTPVLPPRDVKPFKPRRLFESNSNVQCSAELQLSEGNDPVEFIMTGGQSVQDPGHKAEEEPMGQARGAISSPTVGIITALPHESAAIRAVLGDPPRVDVPGSGRIYWMAEVPSPQGGLHRVVIAQAGMGNNSAAIRAGMLFSHFPSIHSIIMCGIGGGIPNPAKPDDHVRLGDIVVSNLKGVVQYDFIKRTVKKKRTDVPEEVRAAPHRPSADLLEAVEALVSDEHLGRRPWERWLEEGLGRLGWARPDASLDVLADEAGVVHHPPDPKRRSGQPRVFLGPIASANILLKDPAKRDELRDRFGAKAVEMEGAGITDATWTHGIGYLVVRGICDYCDGNKNDIWQNYAAMASASYVRALLEFMPGAVPTNPR